MDSELNINYKPTFFSASEALSESDNELGSGKQDDSNTTVRNQLCVETLSELAKKFNLEANSCDKESSTVSCFACIFPSYIMKKCCPLIVVCLLLSSQYYIIIIMMPSFMRVSYKLVFHQSKYISAIKRIRSTTATYISSSSRICAFLVLLLRCMFKV